MKVNKNNTITTPSSPLALKSSLTYNTMQHPPWKLLHPFLSPRPAQWPWLSGSSPHGFWPGTAPKITIIVQVPKKQSTFGTLKSNEIKYNLFEFLKPIPSTSRVDGSLLRWHVKALSPFWILAIGGHKFELTSLDHTQPTWNSGWSILVDFDFSRHLIDLRTGTTKNAEKNAIHCFESLLNKPLIYKKTWENGEQRLLRHDNLDSSLAYQSGGKSIPQRIVLYESQSNNYCEHVFIIESLSLSTHLALPFSVSWGITGITHPKKRVHIVTTIADAGRGPVRTAPQAKSIQQHFNSASLSIGNLNLENTS